MSVYTDNITALKYVTKARGTASSVLQDFAVKIQNLCNFHSLKVCFHYAAGVDAFQPQAASVLESRPRSLIATDGHLQPELEQKGSVPLPTMAYAS
ncbi:hypothetical protein [Parasitella parasitica]|uniref:Uncharacterized protein n=1 Tax=Parasitella parasitica TaxID=35722 RepID=A0A0B7N065_9FUNG|nr:hypothetical protein [Parasitella parasitica]